MQSWREGRKREMTFALKLSPSRTRWVRGAAYLLAIVLVAAFLWRMGGDPWRQAAAEWHIMLLLAVLSGFGLIVQAMAFRLVVPDTSRPQFTVTLAIWSVSAAVSVVAPLVAGLAARTTLLVRHGMGLSACAVASLRQVWLGLEYALLLSSLALPFTGWALSVAITLGCGGAWLAMLATRLLARNKRAGQASGRLGRAIDALRAPVPVSAHPWFVLQVLTMSAVYLVGFNGLGAHVTAPQAVALSGLTVVLSLIAFVPNGLGITDAVWIFIARGSGLDLEQAVALAIVLRLSHFAASACLAMALRKRLNQRS